jgi:hypothetical protein
VKVTPSTTIRILVGRLQHTRSLAEMEPLGEEGERTHLIILGLHNQVDSTLKTKTLMSLRESVTTRLYKAPNVKIDLLGRPLPGSRPRRCGQQKVEVDDSLSMMTSALLTMLDTPEDSQAEHYQGYSYDEQRGLAPQMSKDSQAEHYQGYGYDEQRGWARQMLTAQQMRPQYPPTNEHKGLPNLPGDASHYHPDPQYTQMGSYYDQNTVNDRVLGLMMPGPQNGMDPPYHPEDFSPKRLGKMTKDTQGWLSNWQGHAHPGRSYEENARSMSAVRSQPSSNSPHSPSNVGLYLP